MSKTLLSIVEIGAIVGLQFTGIGAVIDGALGLVATNTAGILIATTVLAGAETLLNSVLQKSPKPSATEPAGKPAFLPARAFNGGAIGLMTAGSSLGRRGRDDLFETDRYGRTY